MITNRTHEAAIAELQHTIHNLQQKDAKAQRHATYATELAVKGIWDVYHRSTAPKIKATIDDVDERNLFRLPVPKYPDILSLRIGCFQNGILLRGVTLGFLEDRSHAVIVRGEKNIQYFRHAINVDCQYVGSKNVAYDSLEATAKDSVAVSSLAMLAGALSLEADLGWKHAYPEYELARVSTLIPAETTA